MDLPVDAAAMQFDMAEAARAARNVGAKLSQETLRDVLDANEGWPTGVMFALRWRAANPGVTQDAIGGASAYDALAKSVLAQRSQRESAFLQATCLLPSMDAAVCAAAGWDGAGELIAGMEADAGFIFVSSGSSWRYHDRFAECLVARLREQGADSFAAAARATIAALEKVGEPREALRIATKYCVPDQIERLLDRHGLQMIARGDAHIVKAALETTDVDEAECSGITLALKALFESRSGRFDTSEAWFQLAMARVEEPVLRAEVAYLYGCDLQQRRRRDSVEILAPYAALDGLPVQLRVSLLSTLAQGHLLCGNYELANACVSEALAAGKKVRDKGALAKLHVRAAYVALYSGNRVRSKTLALRAARHGESGGDYHVACGSYSILYALAADADEPARCLEFLARIRENGAKCGDPRWQLYALMGAYELEVERCEIDAVALLRAGLKAFDVHYATLDSMEALLPSQALELTWKGNFTDAHRLLAPSARQQVEPDRQGLRWAEVALYAAAAGRKNDASAAVRSVRAALKTAAPSVRARRAEILACLAVRLLGRTRTAARLLDAIAAQPPLSPRLSALTVAVRELCRRLDGESNRRELTDAMSALVALEAGGLSRMLLAIPGACVAQTARYRSGIAKTLDSDRADCAAHLLERSVAPEERSIGVHLATDAFVERLVEFLDDRRTSEFAAWLDGFLDRYADLGPVREIVSHGPAALGEFFAERVADRAGYGDALRALDPLVHAATLRPRRNDAGPEVEILDEIDAALNDLLFKLDRADPLTAEHSRAVASWSARLARKFGLAPEEITFASRCGLIHDIGKMTTPAEILTAPRALDEREWKIMRNHAATGERIVRTVPLLAHLAPAVRSHHERLDGRGYPDQIVGSGIPFVARLVSVADCFNAMIGRRPYRRPMSPYVALDELERHRNDQFDPELVQAMIEVVAGK
jgi:putative nucleotidyltransferase with HDIG domain